MNNLESQGWTQEEIAKTMDIMGSRQKPAHVLLLDSLIYWIVLIVALLGNFIISVVLIPFLITLKGWALYSVITIIAVAFGAFFDLLIKDIERINRKKVILGGIFLPIVALITVWIMTTIANRVETVIGTGVTQQPLLVAAVYVVAFILPYLVRTSVPVTRVARSFR